MASDFKPAVVGYPGLSNDITPKRPSKVAYLLWSVPLWNSEMTGADLNFMEPSGNWMTFVIEVRASTPDQAVSKCLIHISQCIL